MKKYIRKIYIIFSYIITFLMLLSLSTFLIVHLLKIFFNKFYIMFYGYINMFLLASNILLAIYITTKYYVPSTYHVFHDDIY